MTGVGADAEPAAGASAAAGTDASVAGGTGAAGEGAATWERRAAELAALRAGGHWLRGPSTALGVLGQQALEDAHERYLAFLLDPHGTHGLGSTLLAALLRRAGRADIAADTAALAQAEVRRQVVGTASRPDLVVTAPRFTLVVELKIRTTEGHRQTPNQQRDFAHHPDPVFVYLTPSGRSALSTAFRPVSLLQLSRDLTAALKAPPRAETVHAERGRTVARDYLNALEDVLGMSPVNDAAARFWLTHNADMALARQAASDLLAGLPERTHAVLTELAPRLGEGLEVAWIEYDAVGGKDTYPEVAVVLGRREWLTPGQPRCGFGLGQRRQRVDPKDNGERAPFVGFYCEDDRMRDAVSAHFGRRQWGGHWARWAYLPLRPEPRLPVLEGLARRVAESVTMGWREDGEVMERFRAGTPDG
ncbi:PD-(D/E)XK nuclease family protein [Kitasatospora sp. RB6PN24]|uniref:PD-(D/E)XK nuclease family protein n=1 Tax=Kitasatospora humi TaxID=2893891 RepID=UPI001E4E1D2C|nr:PD-(D/E)XK nuclease family protein [Kitasatospora humi]MCC9311318.1 PD-(D/E)XK nuclease family protein [Kitasatospora humi]